MPECDFPYWVRLLQAIGPIVVAIMAAIIAGIIAYRQWKTAHDKLRFDLFQERIEVYGLLVTSFEGIIRNGMAGKEELALIYRARSKSEFIFGSDVINFIDKMQKDGFDTYRSQFYINDIYSENRQKSIELKYDILKSLPEKQSALTKIFAPYLSFKKYKS